MRWSNGDMPQVTDGQLLMQIELKESPVIFFIIIVFVLADIILEREKHPLLLLLFSLIDDKQAEGNRVQRDITCRIV